MNVAEKKTLFLHPGLAKTGSSALQVFFAKNVDALHEQGVIYPKTLGFEAGAAGEISSGNAIGLSKYFNSQLPHDIDPDQAFQDVENVLTSSDRSVLFSSEFMQHCRNEPLENLKNLANNLGYDVRAIIFVRSPVELYYSSYSQLVKKSCMKMDFEEFVRSHPINQFGMCQVFNNILGTGAVNISTYDQYSCGKNISQQTEILTSLGIEDYTGFTFESEKINRRLGAIEVQVLRFLNNLNYSSDIVGDISDELTKTMLDSESGMVLNSDLLELIKTRHSAEAEKFEKIFNIDIDVLSRKPTKNSELKESESHILNNVLSKVIELLKNKK